MTHECHAHRCSTQVPPSMFMCLRHWRMVPKKLQDQIWKHYVDGQETRKDPTDAYLEASRAAILAVSEKEYGK